MKFAAKRGPIKSLWTLPGAMMISTQELDNVHIQKTVEASGEKIDLLKKNRGSRIRVGTWWGVRNFDLQVYVSWKASVFNVKALFSLACCSPESCP